MEKIVFEQSNCIFEYSLPDKDEYERYLHIFMTLLKNNEALNNNYKAKFNLSINDFNGLSQVQFCQLVKKDDIYDSYIYYHQLNITTEDTINNLINQLNREVTEFFRSEIVHKIPCDYLKCNAMLLHIILLSLSSFLNKGTNVMSTYISMIKCDHSVYDLMKEPDLYEEEDSVLDSSLPYTSSSIGDVVMISNPSTMISPLNDYLNFLLICSFNNQIFKIQKSFTIGELITHIAIEKTQNSILLNLKGAKLC